MRVSFDRDLVGEAGEFKPLRDEALFRGAPKARQLLERGYLFRLRGFERGLDIDEALRVGLVGHQRCRTVTVHVRCNERGGTESVTIDTSTPSARPAAVPNSQLSRDRKSTRLNSSH